MPIINLSLAEEKILFYSSDEVLTKYKMILLLVISILNKAIALLSFI